MGYPIVVCIIWRCEVFQTIRPVSLGNIWTSLTISNQSPENHQTSSRNSPFSDVCSHIFHKLSLYFHHFPCPTCPTCLPRPCRVVCSSCKQNARRSWKSSRQETPTSDDRVGFPVKAPPSTVAEDPLGMINDKYLYTYIYNICIYVYAYTYICDT